MIALKVLVLFMAGSKPLSYHYIACYLHEEEMAVFKVMELFMDYSIIKLSRATANGCYTIIL